MNTSPAILTVVLTSFLLTGCASNEPTPEMRAWIGKQLAEKQKLEAAQTQELARLKAENERIKAEAAANQQKSDLAHRQAEARAWVVANKKMLLEQLTQSMEPHRQQLLGNYGIQGQVMALVVEDVELRGNVMYALSVFIWQNPDGTGGAIRVLGAQDLIENNTVRDEVVDRKDFSKKDFAALSQKERTKENMRLDAAAQQSAWAPTQETVNTGYQAAIKVAAAAAGAALVNILSGN